MKIGIVADLLQLPLDETIEAAARFDVDGIQLYAHGRRWNLCNLTPEKLLELRCDCEKKQLEISALCGDLGGHAFEIAEANPERIARTRKIIDTANLLGTSIITGHIGVVSPDPDNSRRRNMKEALYEVGNYAFDHGVSFAIETGPEKPELLREFIQEIGSPGIKVNLDPANLKMVLDYPPVMALEILAPYIVHTHAKDGHHVRKCDPVRVYGAFAEGGFPKLLEETGELFHETRLGQGDIDWDEYLALLKKINDSIFLTVEREVGDNPVEELEYSVNFLRNKTNGKGKQ